MSVDKLMMLKRIIRYYNPHSRDPDMIRQGHKMRRLIRELSHCPSSLRAIWNGSEESLRKIIDDR